MLQVFLYLFSALAFAAATGVGTALFCERGLFGEWAVHAAPALGFVAVIAGFALGIGFLELVRRWKGAK